jgi:acylphosphatase
MQRRQVTFRGRVQGVGFRATTHSIALRYEVAGFVRNLPDGSVELVAEGEPAELTRFLEDLQRTMSHYIQDTRSFSSEATGEFHSFEVRYR